MSKSRAKGTAFETMIKDYLIEQGLEARRNPLAGSKDVGDLDVREVSAVWELKNCVKLNLGVWITESEQERINAGKRWAFTIFKRKGKGKPEEQFALMPVATLVELIKAAYPAT